MSIDFVLYSFVAITALLCTMSMNFKVLGSCITALFLFVIIWYTDLGICYVFFTFSCWNSDNCF